MKFIISLFILFLAHSIINLDFIQAQSTKSETIDSIISKLTLIDGGVFTMGSRTLGPNSRREENDSTLLVSTKIKRTSVESFYLSATEVTNAEWNLFYKAKIAEVGDSTAKAEFYPDISLWDKENYFSSPDFNNHPVVGITWEQANSFCKWLTDALNEQLKKEGFDSDVEIRLPIEAEWEYAAIHRNQNEKQKKEINNLTIKPVPLYCWPADTPLHKIKDLTNLGRIKERSGTLLKDYNDDGCLSTCSVASYAPNAQGIFDMGGNVSEWTNDKGYIYGILKQLYSVKDIENEIRMIEDDSFMSKLEENERLNYKHILESKQKSNEIIICLTHDLEIFTDNHTKICKGGTWANGLIYAQVGSRHIYEKSESSTKLGFRIAMSIPNKELIELMPKKKWKP